MASRAFLRLNRAVSNSQKKSQQSLHGFNHDGFGFFLCTEAGHIMFVDSKKITVITDDGKISAHSGKKNHENLPFTYDKPNDTWRHKHEINVSNTGTVSSINVNNTDCAREKILSMENNNFNNYETIRYSLIQHIVVIGDTGVGKSSLVKLLTNDEKIEISKRSDPKSCTKETSHYIMNSRYTETTMANTKCQTMQLSYIYDTKGTQDSSNVSENKTDDTINHDHKVLNDTQKQIYQNNGNLLKIIWIVKNDCKASDNLQNQAKFISKFDNNYGCDGKRTDESIWDSVLLIVHEPRDMYSLIECAQGAINASQDHGCQTEWVENKNIIGYTNIDWVSHEKRCKISSFYDTAQQKLAHYYNSREIKSMVNQSLNNFIKCYKIIWRKDKCIKCGIIGDGRFFNDQRCHLKSLKRHKKDVISQHLGTIDSKQGYHKGKLRCYHSKPASKFYHKYKDKTKHIHPNNLAGYFYLFSDRWKNSKNTKNNKTNYNNFKTKADAIIGFITSPVCAPLMSMIYETQDKCCYCNENKNTSKGCLQVYQCCDRYVTETGDNGCVRYPNNLMRYLCCGARASFGDSENQGCYCYYDCCPEKHVQCQMNGKNITLSDSNSKLLMQNIACCKICSHCHKDISDYSGQSNHNIECGFVWPCCNSKGKWQDRHKEKFKCFVVCRNCNKPWGNSIGCVPGAHHEIVSLSSINISDHDQVKLNRQPQLETQLETGAQFIDSDVKQPDESIPNHHEDDSNNHKLYDELLELLD